MGTGRVCGWDNQSGHRSHSLHPEPRSLHGHPGNHSGYSWGVPKSSRGGGSQGITGLAAFAGAPPGSAEGGTALGPQGGSAQVRFTAALLDLEPAGALGAVCGGGGDPVHPPAHTCMPTHRDPARPRVGRRTGQQGPCYSMGLRALSPRHMVPEGPSRLPGAHSQA